MALVIPINVVDSCMKDKKTIMENKKIISVAIIEDIKEIAYNLKDIINDDELMTCQNIYHNGEEALTFLPKMNPDLILIDIGLPGISGIETIVRLRTMLPETQFCMFTVFEDDDKIFRSLAAGAKGYILKNSAPYDILNSLKELYKGGSPMNPTIARRVIDSFTNKSSTNQKNLDLPLSKRELQILDKLSQGLLYKEISAELGITVGTVKQHIHKIYYKLEVNNKTEAINLYLRR